MFFGCWLYGFGFVLTRLVSKSALLDAKQILHFLIPISFFFFPTRDITTWIIKISLEGQDYCDIVLRAGHQEKHLAPGASSETSVKRYFHLPHISSQSLLLCKMLLI